MFTLHRIILISKEKITRLLFATQAYPMYFSSNKINSTKTSDKEKQCNQMGLQMKAGF